MQQFKTRRLVFFVSLGLLICLSVALYIGLRIETHNLLRHRVQIMVSHVHQTLTKVDEMIQLANGPQRGDLTYFRPIHEKLLGQTPSLESLDAELEDNYKLLNVLTFGGQINTKGFEKILYLNKRLYDSYVEAKGSVRVLKYIMDVNAYEYTLTNAKLSALKNALQSVEAELVKLP